MSGTEVNDGHGRLGNVPSGLAVAVGCVLFLGGFAWGALVYRPYAVPTDSMTPTVKAGERVLAERISGGEVRRGDVVVFRDSAWGDLPMVKRVVGVGGDKVACCDAEGLLSVNGAAIDEPYAAKALGGRGSTADFEAEVPAGQLFLLGDERSGSLDSRVHLQDPGEGSVPRSDVEARVDAVAWPIGSMIDRPAAFAALPGGVSRPGPLVPVLAAVVIGAVLVLGGALYGPLARRRAGSRASRPGNGVVSDAG